MKLLVLSFLLFLSFFTFNSAQPISQDCSRDANISSTTQLSNINTLLANLVKETILTGYNSSSYGNGNNRVYGLAQCRADVSRKDCSSCIQNAARHIRTLCPNKVDAFIWYEYCFLRYERSNFIGLIGTAASVYYTNVKNVTNPRGFHRELGSLVNGIRAQALVIGNKGFGKGKRKLSNTETIYAFAQCDRDMQALNCDRCLDFAVQVGFQFYCRDRKGCRVLYESCYVRYELYPIYFPLESNKTMALV